MNTHLTKTSLFFAITMFSFNNKQFVPGPAGYIIFRLYRGKFFVCTGAGSSQRHVASGIFALSQRRLVMKHVYSKISFCLILFPLFFSHPVQQLTTCTVL
jgi:hypothetical protein